MTLPTPVFAAGAAACVLAGFLAGAVVAPGSADDTIAQVASYTPKGAQLCLTGEAVESFDELSDEGWLCGRWQRTPGSARPEAGDNFRFVAVQTEGESGGETRHATVIYGDVVE